MNYLQICNIDDIVQMDQGYAGQFSPQQYSKWNEFDSTMLFFEGIHQLCVKIVKKFSEEKLLDNRIIPSQIRSLELMATPEFNTYFFLADYDCVANSYLVTFKIFNDNEYSKLVTSGEVYLSKLK